MQQNTHRFASLRAKHGNPDMVLPSWIASFLAMTESVSIERSLFSIDLLQTVFAQAIIVMFLQIGFCGISELHLDAPTVDGMHAFEGFSATGTGFCHLFIVDC
jgi:hypothetical protein